MSDTETIARLEQENAELKLRVQRLELYVDLFNAPEKSTDTQVIHDKIRTLETSAPWLSILQEIGPVSSVD